MRVVFLIDVFDSFGEREHALSFARQLAAAGIETHFVATEPAAAHLRASGTPAHIFATPGEAMRIIDSLRPEWLVACEYFNLPRTLQHAVSSARYRLATMDGTTMGPAINAYAMATAKLLPLPMPERMIRLRPCPVNAPLPVPLSAERTYCWSLFPGLARTDGSAARRRWSLAADTRLAMLALAPWALAAAARLSRSAHYRNLLLGLVGALAAARVPVELLVISPDEAPSVTRERVTIRFVRYLPPDVYEELLLGCDLVLSDNVIQTSVSKAFVAQIPTVVVVDSRPEAPPWNIFPLDLRFPDDAPYYRAIAPVEMSSTEALHERVAVALAGQHRDDQGYRSQLSTLPTPAAILAGAPL